MHLKTADIEFLV